MTPPAAIAETRSPASPTRDGRVSARLAWRIPAERSPYRRNALLLGAALIAVVCVSAGYAFAMGQMGWPELVIGLGVLLGFACYWVWRWRRELRVEDNVWLDDDGLGWLDGSSTGRLPRREVDGFRVGLDPDTVRAIPALTLILVGGFESQPVELHLPAAPTTVRDFLAQRWQVAEMQPLPSRQRELLYRTLEAALVDSPSPSQAESLLLDCLIAPEPVEGGSWKVFRLPADDVLYDPRTCGFQLSSDGAENVATVKELVAYVEQSVLPEDHDARRRMLAEAEQKSLETRRCGEAADAARAGFTWRDEAPMNRWVFRGSQQDLVGIAQQLAKIADHHAPPSAGARPALVRLGGLFQGVTVEVNRYDGIAGDVLCGTPERLREIAADIRSALGQGAEPGETVEVPVFFDQTRWTLAFEIV